MPSSLLHVQTLVTCAHKGKVTIASTQDRVRVGGMFVATENDIMSVQGCTPPLPGAPPCVSVGWIDVAKKVRVMGSRVLLANSQGMGKVDPVPGVIGPPPTNGPVDIIDPQTPVKGT